MSLDNRNEGYGSDGSFQYQFPNQPRNPVQTRQASLSPSEGTSRTTRRVPQGTVSPTPRRPSQMSSLGEQLARSSLAAQGDGSRRTGSMEPVQSPPGSAGPRSVANLPIRNIEVVLQPTTGFDPTRYTSYSDPQSPQSDSSGVHRLARGSRWNWNEARVSGMSPWGGSHREFDIVPAYLPGWCGYRWLEREGGVIDLHRNS